VSLFTLALYLQQGLGKSAGYSGLALVSWVAAFGIPGPVLGRFAGRARALAAPAGSLILAAGFAGLAACLLAGNTSGIVLITLIQAVTAGPPEHLAARLREYVTAGVRHLAVRIATTSLASQREQLELLIKLKPMLSGR
jgi:hypothetical protein